MDLNQNMKQATRGGARAYLLGHGWTRDKRFQTCNGEKAEVYDRPNWDIGVALLLERDEAAAVLFAAQSLAIYERRSVDDVLKAFITAE